MSTALTFDEAVRYLNDAVAARGDGYVYEREEEEGDCLYAQIDDSGVLSAGCIVGHVLHHGMGVPLEDMYGRVADAPVLLEDLGVTADTRTIRMLRDAQLSQDKGYSWGESVREAVRKAGVAS